MKNRKISKLFAIILTLVMLLGAFPILQASAASSSNVILDIPWNYINKCGHQAVSGPCQAYCWAYCRIILDKTSHTYLDYYVTGVGGVAPSTAGYNDGQGASSVSELLKIVYDNINQGRPVMLRVVGSYAYHYVVAVGYKSGSDPNNLKTSDILILDPANKSITASAGSNLTYTYLDSCTISGNRYWTPKSGNVSMVNSTDSSPSSSNIATDSTTLSAPTVSSTEEGTWFVYVPANYKLLLYSNAAATSSASYCSARDVSYRVVCSQKSTLSNGTVRYYGTFNTNDHYWLTYTSSMTVESESTVKTHTINFHANGGSVSTSYKQVTAGGIYGDLPIPTRDGYTFDGWYTAISGGTQIVSSNPVNLSSDQITLYAHWTANAITYTQKSGTWVVEVPKNFKILLYDNADSTSSTSYYTTDGPYDTEGFLCSQQAILSDGTIRYATGFFENDISVTKWFTLVNTMSVEDQELLPTYTVTLNANGGNVSPSTITVKQGSSYNTIPTPTWEGHTFNGWYTAVSGGTQIKATYGLSENADHMLYAHWTENGVVASGSWDSVMTTSNGNWKLDSEGILTITAIGDLYNLHYSNGSLAGYEDQVKYITIKEGATGIVNLCTGMKNLVSVDLPASLSDIGRAVFSDCASLTHINISEQNPWYCSVDGVVFSKDMEKILLFPKGRSGSYTIPSGVRIIEYSVFDSYILQNLETLEIPESVMLIKCDDWAFDFWRSVKLIVHSGSYAEKFATENCLNYTTIR